MKKRIACLAVGVFLALNGSMAQVKVDRGYGKQSKSAVSMQKHRCALAIKYGFKVGANFSNMSNDMSFDPVFSMGTGFRAGALVNFHWGQRTASSLPGTGLWGLQPEVLYTNQVVKSDGGNIKLNYLQVPVMLKVYPTTSLSFEIGPEFSYLLSTSPSSLQVSGADIKIGDCKGFVMGAGIGTSYEFGFGLLLGVRYSMGFTDLGKNLKWKNNSNVQVTAGWLF